ncbi:hypothetical protein Pla123a_06610 [Posidoniimonas polymericola]|uniref:PEP-CTERM protein-sorting domain-containing protein n=1 Tax=Posidoniimonas polymericola TaxID=2528002 RepID=A0A5C5ZER4_9BACT|nr:hypothetical protein [Posidoniimonas polymericola]TWT85854.1 hypothetical protein Pla123a_06610 [Posidoniimonas polymericola]
MKSFAVLLLAAAWTANASAVSIFLSTSATDPSATRPMDLSTVGFPFDPIELFIWITPDPGAKINGASFDIVTTHPDKIQATAISVNNPLIFGTPAWQGAIKPGDLNTNGHLVDGTLAVAVTSQGINAQLDSLGLDSRNFGGSWNYGSLTIDVRDPRALELYELYAAPNAVNPFTVEGQGAVPFEAPRFLVYLSPEPAAAALACLAVTGALGFRRRP